MSTLAPSAATGPLAIKGTSEQIADRLRTEIEQGVLEPGAFLNQVVLANRFGLSRIPVREALRQLNAEGYVTYRPNKGANVATASAREDVDEILEIRECIEARLMDHAVGQFTPRLLRAAAEALHSMNRASAGNAELRGLHQDFHTLLFAAARKPRMQAIVNDWRFRLDPAGDDEPRTRAFIRATRTVHRELLDACAKGDRSGVRRLIAAEYEILRAAVQR